MAETNPTAPPCCQSDPPPPPFYQNEKFKQAMNILEKICLVALVAFAFYSSPKLCAYFTAGGFVIGLGLTLSKKIQPQTQGSIGCSQGFLEQLTGVRLPPPIGLVANAAILVDHMRCHSSPIYVAITGFNFGLFLGHSVGTYVVPPVQRAWRAHISPRLPSSLSYCWRRTAVSTP